MWLLVRIKRELYTWKYQKPIDQAPSKFLIRNLNRINILEKPIIDAACGYDRNGAYLAKNRYKVIFIDYDIDCLKYIQEGKTISDKGHVDKKYIRTIKKDLENELLPFPDESVGGVIDIHYYNPLLINESVRVLCKGGFLCFESIEARGKNIDSLPEYGSIRKSLKNFEIIEYHEYEKGSKWMHKATLKVLAIKK